MCCKPFGCATEIVQVVGDRRRSIDHQHDINGHLAQAEITERLLDSVFENAKIFLRQAADKLARSVPHGHGEHDLSGID